MTIRITKENVIDGLNLVRDNYPSLTGAPDPDVSECAYSMEDGTAWCIIGKLLDLWGFRIPPPESLNNTVNVNSLFRHYFPHVTVDPIAMRLLEQAQTLNDEVVTKTIQVPQTVEGRRTMKEVVDIVLAAEDKKHHNW